MIASPRPRWSQIRNPRLLSRDGASLRPQTNQRAVTYRANSRPSYPSFAFFHALLQPLEYVRTILAPIKSRRLGEPTVQNLRQPDQRLKIELGPFGHHAVEYFAAVLLSRLIKTGEEVLSQFLV
jgi:hypothetical protein